MATQNCVVRVRIKTKEVVTALPVAEASSSLMLKRLMRMIFCCNEADDMALRLGSS